MHPKTTHHYCSDFDDNNLKAILNATFFFCHHPSLTLKYHQDLEESMEWRYSACFEVCLYSLYNLYSPYDVLGGIYHAIYLGHVIFSFYLQNVYVYEKEIDPYRYSSFEYVDVKIYDQFCVSFWFLWIQIDVFFVTQIYHQSFSKWMIVLLFNYFQIISQIFQKKLSQMRHYFIHYAFCYRFLSSKFFVSSYL